jgi:NTP pyrophosphatase (non-canonical NTP hydrolase)
MKATFPALPDSSNPQGFVTYGDFVQRLAKPGEDILSSLTPLKCHLLHMVLGIAGEAGELVDAVKKHVIYNKELDLKNVVEELGDLNFYIQDLQRALCVTDEKILIENVAKLAKRYGEKYSDAAAQARADKA